jgi:hypothetical protein
MNVSYVPRSLDSGAPDSLSDLREWFHSKFYGAHLSLDIRGGLYLRLIDSCITQLKAQGLSGTCNESIKGEKEELTEARFIRIF